MSVSAAVILRGGMIPYRSCCASRTRRFIFAFCLSVGIRVGARLCRHGSLQPGVAFGLNLNWRTFLLNPRPLLQYGSKLSA